jgi:hypothetical protein
VKTCKKCGETKALELFNKSTRTLDGHLGSCKSCLTAYKKQWKQDNPNKNIEYYDNYLAREGKSRRVLKTDEEKRIKYNETQTKWRKADRKKHPEKYKSSPRKIEWQKIDRLMHPEKYRGYVKNCYERNRQKYIARTKAWYEDNKEYVAKKQKVYNRNRVDKLQDPYVKSLIKGKGELSIDDIPKALIEVKRLEILIKRRVKNENSNNT